MTSVHAPPIKIQGIKTRAVSHIQENVDLRHGGRWIEPFLGSASVLLNVNPKQALVGDTNPHLIRFYGAVQKGSVTGDTVRAFLEREGARLLRDGEDHYYRIRERFNDRQDPHDFLFLNRACFNGLMRFNRCGQFNTPFCRKPERFRAAYVTKICNQVLWAADRIKGKRWEFICADWRELLAETNKDDFVYADPPYAGRHTDYFNTWNEDEGRRVESALKALPCRFLYSMWSENRYRRNDELHRTFADYEIRTFSHFYHLGASESLRNGMTEALVIG